LSRTIAKDRQDSNYYIAHASLADIENGKLTPTIYKLYSFTASVSFMDLTTTGWRSLPGYRFLKLKRIRKQWLCLARI
jgi:hypothetical protein